MEVSSQVLPQRRSDSNDDDDDSDHGDHGAEEADADGEPENGSSKSEDEGEAFIITALNPIAELSSIPSHGRCT
jgi:hypothetical protein